MLVDRNAAVTTPTRAGKSNANYLLLLFVKKQNFHFLIL
jgi:hypothetical protein